MRIFGVETWDDEGQLTSFYTIRKDGAEESETDAFFLKFDQDPKYGAAARSLATFLLEIMGDLEGAKKAYFRFEGAADGLPPEPRAVKQIALDFDGFPLRLYCMRLTEGLVILMNGGIKSSQSARESPDLRQKFDDANAFAKAIDKALRDKAIAVDHTGRKLLCNDDEIVVYY